MASLLSIFLLLVAVAFFTLLERKVLAYIMVRKGPSKPSLAGWFVPFADAAKLLTKAYIHPTNSSSLLSVFSCYLSFIVPSLLWILTPWFSQCWDWVLVVITILLFIGFSVYALLAAGWGSNSKYSTLAGIRCIAQCISYEVCITLLLLRFRLFLTLSIFTALFHSSFLLFCHLVLILLVIALAETNRSPFDFAEGESELVSGYNVEYSGPGFVILFLSEYLSILFICSLLSTITLSHAYFSGSLLATFYGFFFVWARGTLPRYRYDQLISLAWHSLLPILLAFFFLLLVLFYLSFCFES